MVPWGVRRMNVLRGLPRSNVEEIDKRWQGRRLHQGEAAARSGRSERPCAGGGNAPARRAANVLPHGCATDLAPTCLLSTAELPATEHSAVRARLYSAVVDEVRQAAWKADIVCRAECPSDLSQQEVCLLVDRVAELEREPCQCEPISRGLPRGHRRSRRRASARRDSKAVSGTGPAVFSMTRRSAPSARSACERP